LVDSITRVIRNWFCQWYSWSLTSSCIYRCTQYHKPEGWCMVSSGWRRTWYTELFLRPAPIDVHSTISSRFGIWYHTDDLWLISSAIHLLVCSVLWL